MSDEKNPEVVAEAAVAAPAVTPAADPLVEFLKRFGVSDEAIANVKAQGATAVDDLTTLTEADFLEAGVLKIPVRKLMAALKPAVPAATVAAHVDPAAELPEDERPSQTQVTSFATSMGLDPMSLMLFMNGMGGEMDFSGLIPIPTMVASYNPKLRNMFLMVLGQVESQLGVPIIVIDSDGSVNKPLTVEYIEGLQEGREAAENNIYFDAASEPHEVIRVGVDAQSVYDADPINPTKALQKNGMGTGRVNWNGVPLEVRQVAYYAVTQTHEIDPTNDSHLAWLRDHMKGAATRRLVFHGQASQAIGVFNEAVRTGSTPTLRVMLSRGPRRLEIMPRRRRSSARDLTGIGGSRGGEGEL